jgi:putative endonuclease
MSFKSAKLNRMTTTIETGRFGEDAAKKFLEGLGYKILHTNWKTTFGEIDIIARDADFLVIVEVKTRHSLRHGNPEEAVNYRKQKQLVNLAEVFIRRNKVETETRFDIISVVASGENTLITHHINAFSPFD